MAFNTQRLLIIILFIIGSFSFLFGQSGTLKGRLIDNVDIPIIFANVALYDTAMAELIKVETSDDEGRFTINAIADGVYNLEVSYVGMQTFTKEFRIAEGEAINIGDIPMMTAGIELEEAIVTARRVMVEVKADRTVFNVDGTINSVGSDGLELLRKAPGVTVDNNDNINVLGRAGVLLYVDGKRLPLAGEDLSNYLKSLPAEQIDKIDIISNPGAKYEAEGNAGIIDIRLKKADNVGTNGTVSTTMTQGRHRRGNINGSGNYRSQSINVFGSLGLSKGTNFSETDFFNLQNGLVLDETERSISENEGGDIRLGVDYFIDKRQTIGVIVTGRTGDGLRTNVNRTEIYRQGATQADSILVANNVNETQRDQYTYNINYRLVQDNGATLNIDVDHGEYGKGSQLQQPNVYFDASESAVLTEVINSFDTPSDISISTFKADYETSGLGGVIGIGTKLSKVVSDNTFIFNNIINDVVIRNDQRSNIFKYDENVYAGYLSYNRSLGDKVSLSAGLRAEQTDATGDLQAFASNLSEPPVELNYLSWFPNLGLTWQVNDKNVLNLSYGRRINRPDYDVLNPFSFQLSEISFRKGNPFLSPEIVNNIELGYTINYRYNIKLSYSKTSDQITRLIAPDKDDPRANFISYDNLANQVVWGFNASAPLDITPKWNVYSNISASHINNQADYGEGAVVDVQAFSYNLYQQHTITLPAGFRGEVSGYFAGPGVWGGVFEYDTSWSLGLGIQKKLFSDQLNIRLSADDIFFASGWRGGSEFDGLVSTGRGNWDSRRVNLSLSYNFGNQKVKSRNRKTGIEDEASRVGR